MTVTSTLDLPPGTGDVQITLRQSVYITGAVIVTTPQNLALEDVRRGILMFRQVEVPILGIVENMSGFVCPKCGTRTEIFGQGGGRRMSEEFSVPFLGGIPLDPGVRTAGDSGAPIVISQPDSPTAGAFSRVAAEVLERAEALDRERLEREKLNLKMIQ